MVGGTLAVSAWGNGERPAVVQAGGAIRAACNLDIPKRLWVPPTHHLQPGALASLPKLERATLSVKSRRLSTPRGVLSRVGLLAGEPRHCAGLRNWRAVA